MKSKRNGAPARMIWRKTKSAWRALGLGQLKSRAAAYAALRERMPPCGSACRGTGAVFVPAAPEFCRVGTEFVKSVPLSMRFGRLGNRFLANLFPDRPLSGDGGTEKRKSVPQSRYAGRLRDRSCPRPTGQTSFGGQKQGKLSPSCRFSGERGRASWRGGTVNGKS